MGTPIDEVVADPNATYYYENKYGGTLPIGSRRLQKRAQRKKNLKYVSKFMFIGGAVGLVVISAIRFSTSGLNSV